MFNVLNQAEEIKPEVMVANFKRWHFSNEDSVVAQSQVKKFVLTFV